MSAKKMSSSVGSIFLILSNHSTISASLKTSFKLSILLACSTFENPPFTTFPTLWVGEFLDINSGCSASIFFNSENNES